MARVLAALLLLCVITVISSAARVNPPRKVPESAISSANENHEREQSRNKRPDAGIVDRPPPSQTSGKWKDRPEDSSTELISYLFCCVLKLCAGPACAKWTIE
ncbi:uncharacterized protein LOC144785169 [Lissotriton helveticus]